MRYTLYDMLYMYHWTKYYVTRPNHILRMPKRTRLEDAGDVKKPKAPRMRTPDTYIPESRKAANKSEVEEQTIQRLFQLAAKNDKIKGLQKVSIMVGATELLLMKLLIKSKFDNQDSLFVKYLNLRSIEFPVMEETEYADQEITFNGSSKYVALSVVYLAYYLYNRQATLILGSVGNSNTILNVNLLVNQFIFKQVDNGGLLVRKLKDKSNVSVSVSQHVTFEFSNLILVSLSGNIAGLFHSIALLADEVGTIEPPGRKEPDNDTFIPQNSLLQYKQNCPETNSTEAYIHLLNRQQYGQNDFELRENSGMFKENILNDSLQKNNFLRIPLLGIFHDPDLMLKDT